MGRSCRAARAPAAKEVTAEGASALEKTRLCKFFLTGRCRRGQACTFAHGEAALQPQPDLFRTQFCYQFLREGTCSFGASCTFAHSPEELRVAPSRASPASGGAPVPDDDLASLQRQVELLRAQLDVLEGREETRSPAPPQPAAAPTLLCSRRIDAWPVAKKAGRIQGTDSAARTGSPCSDARPVLDEAEYDHWSSRVESEADLDSDSDDALVDAVLTVKNGFVSWEPACRAFGQRRRCKSVPPM